MARSLRRERSRDMMDLGTFRHILDYRGYWDEIGDVREWRIKLRRNVYETRKGRSDLSLRPLNIGFDLHEGVFERKYLPKNRGQELLFAGPNVFLLHVDEHRGGHVPDRVTCYWLSVIRYGKKTVDEWIDSLPFKSSPSHPWRDSNGAEVIARIPIKYAIDKSWSTWYDSIYRSIDCDG
jgi:hypothetical protein